MTRQWVRNTKLWLKTRDYSIDIWSCSEEQNGLRDEGESSLKARYIYMLGQRTVIRVTCDLEHFGTELNDARRSARITNNWTVDEWWLIHMMSSDYGHVGHPSQPTMHLSWSRAVSWCYSMLNNLIHDSSESVGAGASESIVIPEKRKLSFFLSRTDIICKYLYTKYQILRVIWIPKCNTPTRVWGANYGFSGTAQFLFDTDLSCQLLWMSFLPKFIKGVANSLLKLKVRQNWTWKYFFACELV
jgi:hypothetical protein